jgi:DNA polymerase I-like protein with 3'-5' exonuclease and polymerase domains
MVGADLAGIELRMLAHYLARYDGGRYADILLNGDIHQVNADKIGISRRQVKVISYAFLYGSGNLRLGHSYDAQLSDDDAKKKGAEIREAFVSAIDGLAELLKAIKKSSKKGYVKSIDGRSIKVESQHKSLNYLLQSGAGVLAKRWMVLTHESLKDTDCHQLAFIHDELQYETHPKNAEYLSSCLLESARRAGEYYNLRVPIAAEAKQGHSWADVH